MSAVKLREGEGFEQIIRRFKKQCEKSGILTEIRKREHYEKPSVTRKRKAAAAQKRLKKTGGGGGSTRTGKVKMKDWAINF